MYMLNKQADDLTIKSYFEGVHELLKSKGPDAFCVNLDEVWPLVYERKDHAIRALTKDYFEGVDYTTQVPDNQVLPQNGKNLLGGRPSVTYYLTVSCLVYIRHLTNGEYFEGVDFQACQKGKVVGINELQNGIY